MNDDARTHLEALFQLLERDGTPAEAILATLLSKAGLHFPHLPAGDRLALVTAIVGKGLQRPRGESRGARIVAFPSGRPWNGPL